MAKLLDSDALSVFCEGMAMMVAAGITTDEAVTLLADNTEEGTFKNVCDRLYRELIQGRSLAESMANTGSFPEYALNMVSVGEESGRLENVLYALAAYYSEENRLFAKLRSAMGYPAGLLAVMTAVLVFTVLVILPVFVNVYNSVS
ncbi:MAG: type II secretion system F family protein, partial [Eggerthellales bacterium]|nr:type II secretion system F family protein [Eggerthellales bacterium]